MPPKRRASDSQPETAIEVELRMQIEQLKESLDIVIKRQKSVEDRLSYYDKVGVKVGAYCMAFLSLGTLMAMGVDKLKEKIIAWVIP